MLKCRRRSCAASARVRRATPRLCLWRQKFLTGLFKRAFHIQLTQRAQIDEVLELPGLRFRFFAELSEDGLYSPRRRERPAVENLTAAQQSVVHGGDIVGAQ